VLSENRDKLLTSDMAHRSSQRAALFGDIPGRLAVSKSLPFDTALLRTFWHFILDDLKEPV
jgi:hypothetical protein